MATTNSKLLRPMGMANHNSGIATISSSVEKRHQSRVRQSLDDRLHRVKPLVDCHQSQTFPHVRANLKRQQALAEQDQKINKENDMLSKKISAISSSERPRSSKLLYSSVNGIRLTMDGTPKIDNHKERFVNVKAPGSRTRQAALEDISLQNLRMASKLCSVQGVYSSQEFGKNKEQQEKYLSMHRPRRVANKPFTPARSWDSTSGPRRSDSTIGSPRQSRQSSLTGQNEVLACTARRLRGSSVMHRAAGLRKVHSEDGAATLPQIVRATSTP
mmetsp:Transcript_8527/g.24464  ORF Transcript_8527/g.24464 Transcript_8527/m.24464 type:complete len:273 (-) Transcript_8527:270-1088(-)